MNQSTSGKIPIDGRACENGRNARTPQGLEMSRTVWENNARQIIALHCAHVPFRPENRHAAKPNTTAPIAM